ncbi:hypothetical protein G9A89_002179 [Geosiphon pyriformis]|nr:hypothetical protein G9A89_002179 [Geosiphon pyriformis]
MKMFSKFCFSATLTLFSFLILLPTICFAHLPFYEPERLRAYNWNQIPKSYATYDKSLEDFSFSNPFDIKRQTAVKGQNVTLRPYAAYVVNILLNGVNDYDVFKYNKTDNAEMIFTGYLQVPACKEYENFYPALALLGPLTTKNSKTKEYIFKRPNQKDLSEFPWNFGEGYGYISVQDSSAGQLKQRDIFRPSNVIGVEDFQPHGLNISCLPLDNQPPKCSSSSALIVVPISDPGVYFWVVWDRDGFVQRKDFISKGKYGRYQEVKRKDASLVGGTTDDFTPADFARLADLQGEGSTLHTKCTTPENPVYISDYSSS